MESVDWSNKATLDYIELLQTEPVIWDFRNKDYKKKVAVQEAWQRIQNSFPLPYSLEELKRKRNMLMTSYRAHLKKIIDTANTGNVYKPVWFAFEPMHSYLGPVYTWQNTEEQNESNVKLSLSARECENENSLNYKDHTQLQTPTKLKKCNEIIILPRKQYESDESHITPSNVHERSNINTNGADENYLFCQILGRKLSKMEEDDRLVLTNEINNLVFKYEISVRSKTRKLTKSTSTTSNFSSKLPYFESHEAVAPMVSGMPPKPLPEMIKYDAP